jgi:ATP-dependent Clp protease adaptor protein ClpS
MTPVLQIDVEIGHGIAPNVAATLRVEERFNAPRAERNRYDYSPLAQALQYNGLTAIEGAGTPPLDRIDFVGESPIVSEESSAAVAEPAVETVARPKEKKKKKPKRQPRYHVILWDDNDHSYDYVIEMMQELFSHSKERGFLIAKEVDTTGRAICLTTTLEHAELKRDQIHAFGKDRHITRCKGSMKATIEAER